LKLKLLNKTFSIRYISFICIAHYYLGQGVVIRPKHNQDCSRWQVCYGCLFLAARWVRPGTFMPGNSRVKLPDVNYVVTS